MIFHFILLKYLCRVVTNIQNNVDTRLGHIVAMKSQAFINLLGWIKKTIIAFHGEKKKIYLTLRTKRDIFLSLYTFSSTQKV